MAVGPSASPVTIHPEWRGAPPPTAPVAIESTRGVDIHPVDVDDPAAAARLEAHVWVDAVERQARLAAAIAMVREGASIWRKARRRTGSRRGWPSRSARASRAS
ncbi:DUF2332 family protein [Sphingomonas aurantiaca]